MSKFIGYKYKISGKNLLVYRVRKNRTEFLSNTMTRSMVIRGIKRPSLYTYDYEILLKECLSIARDEMIEKGIWEE